MSALARDTGLNRGNLYEALSEDGNPTLAMVLKLTRVLGCDCASSLSRTPNGTRYRPGRNLSERQPHLPGCTASVVAFTADLATGPGGRGTDEAPKAGAERICGALIAGVERTCEAPTTAYGRYHHLRVVARQPLDTSSYSRLGTIRNGLGGPGQDTTTCFALSLSPGTSRRCDTDPDNSALWTVSGLARRASSI